VIRILGAAKTTCDGMTRREVLRVGGLSLFGALHAPPADARGAPLAGKARSVILIDLFGGPSHLDMFDPKPAAPVEVRGEFATIATTLPGLRICEHLPRTARWMHRVSLLRALSHGYNSHNPYAVMTGFTGGVDAVDYFSKPTNHPSMGSVCTFAGLGRPDVPPYVVLPAAPGYTQGLRRAGPYGGYLGRRFNPLFSTCDARLAFTPRPSDEYNPMLRAEGEPQPELPSFAAGVTLDTLDRRRTLLEQVDATAVRMDAREIGSMTRYHRQAMDLLHAPTARKAFDLAREPAAVRDRYGRHVTGASILLARRLVEAGVTFVTVHTEVKPNYHWDTHENNFNMLRQLLLPVLDQALTALFEDLEVRGLWQTTLVAVLGDMGRTPRVNNKAGRHHWPQCGFCLFAGGGVKAGMVYGSSDQQGAYPKDLPASPGDIVATIYRLMGIDPEMTVNDLTGRPIPISHGGRPIEGIIA
jgi:hypothetical protein